MKLKSLPSMREKKRYVVFRVISDKGVSYTNVRDAVWNSLSNWLGDRELAKANVRIIKNLWSKSKQSGFVQTTPKYVDSIKVGLSLIHQIGDERVIFQTIRVSGTIRSGKVHLK